MLGPFVLDSVNRIAGLAERYLSGRYAFMKIAALWAGVALIVAFPPWEMLGTRHFHYWDYLLQQTQNPFATYYAPPGSHEAEMGLRLVPPIMGHLLGLNLIGYLLFQCVCFLALCLFGSVLLLRATKDVASAAFAAVAFAASGVGSVLTTDVAGNFGTTGLALVALSMWSRVPPLIFVAAFLAAFTDERAGLALAFVWLSHASAGGTAPGTVREKWLRPSALAVVAAVVAALATRLLLYRAFGLYTPVGNESAHFRDHLEIAPLGVWAAIEGGWLIVAGGAIVLALARQWLFLVLLTAATAPVLFAGIAVQEISRSATYLFPLPILALGALHAYEPRARVVTAGAAMISLLWPNYYLFSFQVPILMHSLPQTLWLWARH